MKLYERNYNTISEEEKLIWDTVKDNEIVWIEGKPSIIKKPLYHKYPKAVRHFLSLFPNNFIDRIDLLTDGDHYSRILSDFEILIMDKSLKERDVLSFIQRESAYFIIGSILKNQYMFGHHGFFIFPEFKLAPNYRVDYLIVGKNSDGYHFVFVEFESSNNSITTKDGSYGDTIRKGIKQTEDWDFWLGQNFSHLELIFNIYKNKNEILPDEFRKYDRSRFYFVVVAGRRNDYTEKTYLLRRKYSEQQKLLIIHYDNLIDSARETVITQSY